MYFAEWRFDMRISLRTRRGPAVPLAERRLQRRPRVTRHGALPLELEGLEPGRRPSNAKRDHTAEQARRREGACMATRAREVNLAAAGRSGRRELCPSARVLNRAKTMEDNVGKGILLWLVGVPIPVIILLFACHVIH